MDDEKMVGGLELGLLTKRRVCLQSSRDAGSEVLNETKFVENVDKPWVPIGLDPALTWTSPSLPAPPRASVATTAAQPRTARDAIMVFLHLCSLVYG